MAEWFDGRVTPAVLWCGVLVLAFLACSVMPHARIFGALLASVAVQALLQVALFFWREERPPIFDVPLCIVFMGVWVLAARRFERAGVLTGRFALCRVAALVCAAVCAGVGVWLAVPDGGVVLQSL